MMKLLTLAAFAAPAAMAGTHSRGSYENGWAVSSEAVRANQQVTVTLVVNEQGAEEIRRIAVAVSDPTSPTYGEFLTRQQVAAITAPKTEDMAAVTGWLTANGVKPTIRNSNVVATMSVAEASKLFDTEFHVAEHKSEHKSVVRAGDYTVPAAVDAAVTTIFGLHGLPLPKRQATFASHGKAPPHMPAAVTPDVLASTYSIGGVKVTRSLKNKQAVAEFQGQFMNSTDLAGQFSRFVKGYEVGTDDVVYKFVGKHIENSGGVEAELDIQFIMGPASGIKTEFWEFPGNDFGADLNQWTSNLTSVDSVPLVHSVSYGWQGNLSQIHVKDSDVVAVDSNFQKLAAMGISIMISSGDSGSGYTAPQPKCNKDGSKKGVGVDGEVVMRLKVPSEEATQECCEEAGFHGAAAWTVVKTKHPDTDGKPKKKKESECTIYKTVTGHTTTNETTTTGVTEKPKTIALWASWPASSPWVTAVGATRFIGQKVGNAEMATDQFGSGGGFSTMFDQTNAKWQSAAVAKYLALGIGLPPASSFNPMGRATPDVSCLGEGYSVVVDGKIEPVGGTSASSPAFASMVSLLNEARLNAGKKPMGLLNPFLYQNEDAFTDVTEGSNKVGRGGQPLPYGWNCTAGWDPATGLGTPLFPKLLAAAMK